MSFIDFEIVSGWLNDPYVVLILAGLSFSESAFFIIPPEVLLIPLALTNPALALWYALVTTVSSILGAMFGFFLGKKGGKPVLQKLFAQHHIDTVKSLFQKYDTKAIFVSAFTPIPYKVFTIAAGVFDLNFTRFVIASIIGRGARYFLLAGLIYVFGDSIRYFIEHQLDIVIGVGTVGLISLFGFYKVILPFLEEKILKEPLKDKVIRIFKKLKESFWDQEIH